MKIRSSLIFVSLILLVSCSKVNIENENNDMISRLREKKESTEKLRVEKEGMIDLEEAIDLALKNNTQIKLKEIESQIAKIDKNISFGNFLPRISAMYSISELDRYMSATIPAPDVTVGVLGGITLPSLPVTLTSRMVDKDFRNYALSAQLPIFVPATWFLYSAREKGENISLYTENLTKKMIKLKVISEYYYTLALASEKNVLEKEYAYAQKLNKNAKLALKTGSILKWQEEETELLVKQKENALKNNERDLKIAKMNLMNDIGLDPYAEFRLVIPEDTIYKLPPLEDVVYDALIISSFASFLHAVKRKINKKTNIYFFITNPYFSINIFNVSIETLYLYSVFSFILSAFSSSDNAFNKSVSVALPTSTSSSFCLNFFFATL